MESPATEKSALPKPVPTAPGASGDGDAPARFLLPLLGEGIARFSPAELEWIARAYRLADDSHRGILRLSGGPYIEHPLAVARLLVEMGLDCPTVCAGLLHDTIEDTTVTQEQIQATFPDPVGELVAGVTKISTLTFRSNREEQAENLRKMVLAMARDIRVILIKLADRLHNMQTLQFLPSHKQRRIARSTLEIYAPLAHRLGIYRMKSELEDLAMRYLYPEEYRDLRDRIALKKADRDRHIQASMDFLREHLAAQGIQAEVRGRSKHFWSIFQKMRNQQLSLDEIYDLNALRIICDTRTACYEILGIIHSVWKPVPEHFSDYIALPKANMYQSIHTKVIGLNNQLTEVQVRTWDMHHVAEEGIAAHYRYKEGRKAVVEFDKKLGWLRQMVDYVTDSNEAGELLHDLRQDVFDDKVFCFTPKGDVLEMPCGSTILDFAYRIHTDLGHRCVGGKINQKFVALKAELRMGDIVEIQTSKAPHPSPDWLKIVTTSRARAKIKHFLKLRDFDRNVLRGRDMILKAIARSGLHVSVQELPDLLEKTIAEFHLKSVDDLFSEVGFGAIPTSIVVARLLPPPAERSARRGTRAPAAPAEGGDAIVLVDGMPGSVTRFGQCCRPQPGESITGFVTRGRGISIHHSQCHHLTRWILQSPDMVNRIVPVSWADDARRHRKMGLRVIARDRTGILRDVTDLLASMNIMIAASNSRSDPRSSQAVLRFSLLLQSDDVLNQVMNRLSEVPGVVSVSRDSKVR